jgi:hypothetical protein
MKRFRFLAIALILIFIFIMVLERGYVKKEKYVQGKKEISEALGNLSPLQKHLQEVFLGQIYNEKTDARALAREILAFTIPEPIRALKVFPLRNYNGGQGRFIQYGLKISFFLRGDIFDRFEMRIRKRKRLKEPIFKKAYKGYYFFDLFNNSVHFYVEAARKRVFKTENEF